MIEVSQRPSKVMNPTATNNTKSSKSTDTTTSEANKPVEATSKLTDTKTSEASTITATPKATKPSKKEEFKPLTVSFPSRTLRQLKLLSSIEGVSIASIVVSSVTRSVAKRLPGALEALKSDLEG